jgi:predicted Zn-dependent protease
VEASGLATPGATKLVKRVGLQFAGEVPAECIKIESDKCYALVEVELQQPLNP